MDRVLILIAVAVVAITVVLSQLLEEWIIWGIFVALIGLVVFLFLLARRAFVDFKQGVNEGGGR